MTSKSPVLKRDIRRWDLVALFINVTVGAGVFSLPSEAFKSAGVYSLAAFVICAIVIGLIVLCFAEVASRFTETGGPYLYGREAFGPTFGFVVGWLMWITRLAGFAFLCNVLVRSLGYFWPQATADPYRAMIISAIVIGLVVINIVGVRESAIVGNIFTVGKLLPLLLFIGVGLFYIDHSQFTFAAKPTISAFSHTVFVLIFMFSGFEAILINSGEVREPRRNIPFALIIALIAITLLFVLIQTVCIGTLPSLGNSERPLADAANNFLGPAGATMITICALISVIGTLNAVFLACSRLPFGMADQGQLPQILLRTHKRFSTPHVAILVTAIFALALTLSGTFTYVLNLSVSTRIIIYLGTCVALPVLRKRHAQRPASFELPAGVVISGISVILCLGLLANSAWREARDLAIATAVGLILYLVWNLYRAK
jgi:amino acid transporter